MICETCARIAGENRRLFNAGQKAFFNHPKNCGCACQHRLATGWEKYFSVEEPDEGR